MSRAESSLLFGMLSVLINRRKSQSDLREQIDQLADGMIYKDTH